MVSSRPQQLVWRVQGSDAGDVVRARGAASLTAEQRTAAATAQDGPDCDDLLQPLW